MPITKPQLTPRRNLLSQAISVAIATQLVAVPMSVLADQISPNPNAAGNTISITTTDANNASDFENNGIIDVADGGLLTNSSTLKNHSGGTLLLSSMSEASGQGDVLNSGTLSNYNGGLIKLTGDNNYLNNTGTINNLTGGRILAQPTTTTYTRLDNKAGGVINNQAGASIEMDGSLDSFTGGFYNRGTVNNDGKVFIDRAYFKNSSNFYNNESGVFDSIDIWTHGVAGSFINKGAASFAFGTNGEKLKQTIQNSGSLTLKKASLTGTVNNLARGLLLTQGNDDSSLVVSSTDGGGKIYNNGTWTHANAHQVENYGLIQNELGGQLNNDGTLDNAGTFNNSGSLSLQSNGVLNNAGNFTNNSSGVIKNYGLLDNTVNNQSFNNEGTLTNYDGGKLALSSTESRFIALNTGSLINTSGAEISLQGKKGTLANQGTITNQSGAQINLKRFSNTTNPTYNHFHNQSTGVIENQYGASINFDEHFTYFKNDIGGVVNNSGDISGAGSIYFDNKGTLNNLATGQFFFDGQAFSGDGNLINDGLVELFGDSLTTEVKQNIENRATLKVKAMSLMTALNNKVAGQLSTLGTGSISVKIATGSLYNSGSWSHAAGSHLINENLIQNESTGTLNLGGTIDNAATFTNAGTVNIDATASLYGAGSFTQSAGTTTVNGLLASDAGIAFNAGVLAGTGQINVATGKTLQVAQAATINPSTINDDLTVNGDLALDGTVVIDIESNSINAMDVLTVTGNMDFGVNSDVVFRFHFTPVDGDTTLNLNFLNAGSVSNYSNLSYSFEGISNSNDVSLVQVGNDLQLQVNFDSDGDGIINENDAFPNDASETVDSDGDGTGDNADIDEDNDNLIDINTLADFYAIRHSNDSALHGSSAGCLTTCNGFELINDLDFDTSGDGVVDASDDYWNDGAGWQPLNSFDSTFDGKNHKIKNLTINRPQTNSVGLFVSAASASIKNLTLENTSVVGASYVGALASKLDTSTTVENVSVSGSIQGVEYVGGVIGWSANSQVSQVSHIGRVMGSGERVGGVVGFNDKGTLSRAYHAGSVSGTDYIGGIVGVGYQDTISDVFSVGNISGDREVGGIIGRKNTTNLARSYTLANVTATTSGGAVIGHAFGDGGYTSSYYDQATTYNGIGINADDPDISEALTIKQMSCPQASGDLNCSLTLFDDWDDATPIWDFGYNNQLPVLNIGGVADRSSDFDNDGVNDTFDRFPTISIASLTDTDRDGAPDTCDSACLATGMTADDDDDNDGVADVSDPFPSDKTEWADTDGDGLGDNADQYPAIAIAQFTDADNDGAPDVCDINCQATGMLVDIDIDNDGLIEIASLADLDAMRNDNEGTSIYGRSTGCLTTCNGYELMNDLDFDSSGNGAIDESDDYWNAGQGWLPVGDSTTAFTAIFDGNSNTINNLMIKRDSTKVVALFGTVDSSAQLKNLNLTNVNVYGKETVAALVGRLKQSSVENIAITGRVAAPRTAAGVIGVSDNSQISKVSFVGRVKSSVNNAGGIVSLSQSDTINQAFHIGPVSGTTSIGGIAGSSGSAMSDVFSAGSISGTDSVGGIVGYMNNASLERSFSVSNVSGNSNVGAIIGHGYYSGFSSSYLSDLVSVNAVGGGDIVDTSTVLTAAEFTCPQSSGDNTCTPVIYNDWDDVTPIWSFGSTNDYPGLVIHGLVIRLGDFDNDGALDNVDLFPWDSAESSDIDGDGVGDNGDLDDDNDGVLDLDDQYPFISISDLTDTDADGAPDECDVTCQQSGMLADEDDDNDGIADVFDVFPLDGNESADSDGDTIGDNADTDDDNDGWSDVDELACGASTLNAQSVPTDNDSDSVCDAMDTDDDNDGMPDTWESSYNLDPLNTQNSDGGDDADGDGISNLNEYLNGTNPTLVQVSQKESELMLSPRYYRYGVETANAADCEISSTPVTYTIKNKAANSRQLKNVLFNGVSATQFGLISSTDHCSGQSLAAGSSCTFQVVFCPTSTGNKAAMISITTDDIETPILTSALFDYESNKAEALRRLPPVVSMLTITNTNGEAVLDGNLIEGEKYDFEWQISGYHDSFYSLIAFFNCQGVSAGDCGASSSSNIENSGFLTNPAIGSDIWNYNGITAKTFTYSYQLEVPIVTENTELVVRFYRKSDLDVRASNDALSLMIPGKLDANYYDSSGRRISFTIVDQ